MCQEIIESQMFTSIASGLLGSVIGAGITVLTTYQLIRANAAEYGKQRESERREESDAALDSLRNEVVFNSQLPDNNKRMPVFVCKAWENFLSYSHKLIPEDRRLLNEAYSWALFHNNAAQLEDPIRFDGAHYAEPSFDEAASRFKKLGVRQLPIKKERDSGQK